MRCSLILLTIDAVDFPLFSDLLLFLLLLDFFFIVGLALVLAIGGFLFFSVSKMSVLAS